MSQPELQAAAIAPAPAPKPRKEKKPTAKERRFIEEYLVDLNGTQAAIRAGYSAKSAASIASENLRKPHIAVAIMKDMQARSERTRIDADWLLTRLAEEAQADIAELYDEATGNLKPVSAWPKIFRTGLIAGVDMELVTIGKGKKKKVITLITEFKLSDRVKRLELIGRHVGVGAFKDKTEHSVDEPLKRLLEAIGGKAIGPAPAARKASPRGIRPRSEVA
jgi:phage terminase small subunit